MEHIEEFNQTEQNKKKNYWWLWITLCGIVIGVLLKLFVFEVLHVSGTSMTPAISDGQSIFVNKLAYGIVSPAGDSLLVSWSKPQREDIVVYLHNNKIVVKRCIAIEGDLLEYSFDTGYTLYVGEKNIPLTELQYALMRTCDKVPEGYILTVGDNYAESVDSRNYGFVSVKNILGKVVCN